MPVEEDQDARVVVAVAREAADAGDVVDAIAAGETLRRAVQHLGERAIPERANLVAGDDRDLDGRLARVLLLGALRRGADLLSAAEEELQFLLLLRGSRARDRQENRGQHDRSQQDLHGASFATVRCASCTLVVSAFAFAISAKIFAEGRAVRACVTGSNE